MLASSCIMSIFPNCWYHIRGQKQTRRVRTPRPSCDSPPAACIYPSSSETAMVLSYSKSCLIGAIMESMAYGMYLLLVCRCARILWKRHDKGALSLYLTGATVVLFVLITMRMVLDDFAIVTAFTYAPTTPDAADIYLGSFGNGAMFRTGTYIALTIVSDIFIVFRVYAVWGNSILHATVPALLAVADIVSGALMIQAIQRLTAGSSPDGSSIATHALIFYGFTLGVNILSSFLIALRIYLVQRQTRVIKSSMDLNLAIEVVVESAALYSCSLIAMIAPTATGSNVQYCLLSVMSPIVGIAFSLIIVRVGSGLSRETYAAPPTRSLRFAAPRRGSMSELERSQFQATDQLETRENNEFRLHLDQDSSSRSHHTMDRSRSAGSLGQESSGK
ncbi:hypothetical protein EV361DRAFT_914629 [Lentinula raphanica]|nr:hypothetical protein EV361DRAFT_914629 [Lentinula raphanica]